MKTILCWACSIICLGSFARNAEAQLFRSFVASYGNDANDGSRAAPKKTFQSAHNVVSAGGQIVVLDSAGYGPLTITKSLSIIVPPGVNGFVTVSGTNNGVVVLSGSNDSVLLRGLIIEGGGGSSGTGVLLGNGKVTVEDCTVRNFHVGLLVSTTGAPHIHVQGSVFRDCYSGILVEANGAGSPEVAATASRFEGNIEGVGARPINGGTDFVAVGSSTFTNNNQAVAADGNATIALNDCFFTDNSEGIYSGNNALVLVNNCSITGNFYGVLPGVTGAGRVLSRGNNTLEQNKNGNSFTGVYSAK